MQEFTMEQTKKTHIPETHWAYIAGLFDGEGSLDILLRDNPVHQKSGKGYAREFRLNICSGSKELIDSVQVSFGNIGSITQHKVQPYYKRMKVDNFELKFGANEIRFILPNLIPYLRLKKKVAELMLRILTIVATTKYSNHRELELLNLGKEFRCLRAQTPGSKCKLHRADDRIRDRIISPTGATKITIFTNKKHK